MHVNARNERTNGEKAEVGEGWKNRFVRSDVNMEGNKKKHTHTHTHTHTQGREGTAILFLAVAGEERERDSVTLGRRRRRRREAVCAEGSREGEGGMEGYVVLNPLVVMATDK